MSTGASCGAKWGEGAGIGEEKCSTSVSICAGLRQSMVTVLLQPLILIVKCFCSF